MDWPDDYIACADEIGIREENWSNSPEAIAEWLRWYEALEPLEFTVEEEQKVA